MIRSHVHVHIHPSLSSSTSRHDLTHLRGELTLAQETITSQQTILTQLKTSHKSALSEAHSTIKELT